VLPIFNPPRNFRIPNQIRAPPSPPLTSPKLAKSLRPFSAAPERTRVKKLVANRSRMAPKRSNKKDGKGKESQPPSGEWTYSKCSNNDLLNLVSNGLLQGKNLVNWRPSFRQSFPLENVDEIVLFYHFSERGLALPTCSFFRGLLYFYRLELHHLNANSICHIANFIHFCEAFLGIEPDWDLFRYLFRVKPQPTSNNPSVVGGAGIQLRQQAGDGSFLQIPLQHPWMEKPLILHWKPCPPTP
jgi:hypothetical protein